MNRNVLARRALAGIAVAALALAGCANGDGDNPGGERLSGSVVIDGSSTVAPLTNVAADMFREVQPSVQVPVGVSGTGGGFSRFCKGETDISNASRPIKDSEREECEANNIQAVELTVANDALSVVVNKENDWATCLTVDQLRAMWEPNSAVNNWNQVDPSFPDLPIAFFAPGTDSGTFDYFTEAINGEAQASRTDATFSENDNVLVQGVAGERGGIGYFGLSYLEENLDKLNAVQIDGGSGCVEPTLETAQSGQYAPLGRPLFVYISDAGLDKPQVREFVEFYIENIDEIAVEAAFVPLNDQQKTQLQADYESLASS